MTLPYFPNFNYRDENVSGRKEEGTCSAGGRQRNGKEMEGGEEGFKGMWGWKRVKRKMRLEYRMNEEVKSEENERERCQM